MSVYSTSDKHRVNPFSPQIVHPRSAGKPRAKSIPIWLPTAVTIAALAGCSVYPIPDNVLSIKTEDIVRHARCEMREAIIEHIATKEDLKFANRQEFLDVVRAADKRIQSWKEEKNALKKKRLTENMGATDKKLQRLLDVSAAYAFDFDITEVNKADAGAGFKLPFTAPKVLDVDMSAALSVTRKGQRQFKAGDRWGAMIVNEEQCANVVRRPKNMMYALDGSIGVDKVVHSFIDISKQGGAKESFVDTLIFTTHVGAGANAVVKLSPVPQSFRLVSANAGIAGSRTDIHKLTLSIVFPARVAPRGILNVARRDGDLEAPFNRPEDWRARYNLCVADAREREDAFKQLRHEAPEVYCISYADNFAPQYGPRVRTVRVEPPDARSPMGVLPDRGGPIIYREIEPNVRPNRY